MRAEEGCLRVGNKLTKLLVFCSYGEVIHVSFFVAE
jgi:hypothetical protein